MLAWRVLSMALGMLRYVVPHGLLPRTAQARAEADRSAAFRATFGRCPFRMIEPRRSLRQPRLRPSRIALAALITFGQFAAPAPKAFADLAPTILVSVGPVSVPPGYSPVSFNASYANPGNARICGWTWRCGRRDTTWPAAVHTCWP